MAALAEKTPCMAHAHKLRRRELLPSLMSTGCTTLAAACGSGPYCGVIFSASSRMLWKSTEERYLSPNEGSTTAISLPAGSGEACSQERVQCFLGMLDMPAAHSAHEQHAFPAGRAPKPVQQQSSGSSGTCPRSRGGPPPQPPPAPPRRC